MKRDITEIKNDLVENINSLRTKRQNIVKNFKKRLEEAKIEYIKKSINGK